MPRVSGVDVVVVHLQEVTYVRKLLTTFCWYNHSAATHFPARLHCLDQRGLVVRLWRQPHAHRVAAGVPVRAVTGVAGCFFHGTLSLLRTDTSQGALDLDDFSDEDENAPSIFESTARNGRLKKRHSSGDNHAGSFFGGDGCVNDVAARAEDRMCLSTRPQPGSATNN